MPWRIIGGKKRMNDKREEIALKSPIGGFFVAKKESFYTLLGFNLVIFLQVLF